MKPCASIRELIPWYVNGTLSIDEARHVAAHLSQCEICRDELIQHMRLNIEVRKAFGELEGLRSEIKKNVLKRVTGKKLASLDLGSFLLGFSFGVSYQKGRVPIRGDLRLLGRKIRLISSDKEVHNER
ncbi:zf-HC2 domain-containing protein [Candidatus Bipolaricaulota bacterium]|nr:zf-HC2 domain-containing protein [Candidatus Bipolaricaulota bacterium]